MRSVIKFLSYLVNLIGVNYFFIHIFSILVLRFSFFFVKKYIHKSKQARHSKYLSIFDEAIIKNMLNLCL